MPYRVRVLSPSTETISANRLKVGLKSALLTADGVMSTRGNHERGGMTQADDEGF